MPQVEHRVNVSPGTKYVYTETGRLYEVTGTALNGRTRQEMVVYVGLDGPDTGTVFVCPLSDMIYKFQEVTGGVQE